MSEIVLSKAPRNPKFLVFIPKCIDNLKDLNYNKYIKDKGDIMAYTPITLENFIKNMKTTDIIEAIPFKVYCEETNKSYRIVGVNKEGLVAARMEHITYDNDDDFSFSRYQTAYFDCWMIIKEEDFKNFIYASDPTPRQREWLEYNTKYYDNASDMIDMTGAEAWHIIDRAVKKAQEDARARQLLRKIKHDIAIHEDGFDYDDWDNWEDQPF